MWYYITAYFFFILLIEIGIQTYNLYEKENEKKNLTKDKVKVK